MKKEIQHHLQGSLSKSLTEVSIKWSEYITDKLEEKDLRFLLQKEKFEKLKDITFVGMQWIENPLKHEHPEYAIYLGPNLHSFREVCGQWGMEAYILLTGHQYEYSHPVEQELLMELFEEFKMDELLTKLDGTHSF